MKRNIKNILFVIMIMLVMILTLSINVKAANEKGYTVSMSMTSDSKLVEGDTVLVNVKLTNINAGKGIDTLTAQIDYDTNVFETLTSSDFASNTSWIVSYAESTKIVTAQKNSFVTSAETMFTISLKVKQTISADSTTVTLKGRTSAGENNIIVSGGTETGDIPVNNISVTINKEKAATSLTDDFNTNTTAKPGNITTINDKTTKKTTLPKTGIEQYGLIAVVVIMIVAIFSYVLYKKIAKDVK